MRTIETIHLEPAERGPSPALGDAVEIRVHHWQRGEETLVGQVVSLRHLGGALAFVGLDLPGRYELVWVEAEGCRTLERPSFRPRLVLGGGR